MAYRFCHRSGPRPARRAGRAVSMAVRAGVPPLELLEPRLCLSAATVPSFQPVANIATGGAPTAIVTDDFNYDGNQDIAVALGQSNSVSVQLGNSDGTFGAATLFKTGADPTALATGDFNNDGNDDIVTADAGTGGISILLANADSNGNALGTFASPTNIHVEAGGKGPLSLAVGDFNGDGNPDVAVAGPGGLYVLSGNGDGTFSSPQLVSGGSFSGVVADDFNGDGNTDLATVDPTTGVVDVFQGNGDGTFAKPATYTVGVGASSIASGDFNGDGVEDIAVINPSQNEVEVLLGNTTTVTVPTPTPITPTPITPTPILPGPISQAPAIPITGTLPLIGVGKGPVVQLNANAILSNPTIVSSGGTGSSGSSNGSYSYTTGTGTFGLPIIIHLDQSPSSMTVADVNGDGNLDIVTANAANNSVTVVPGNGDGTFGTPVDLAAGNAPAGVVVDDFNGDGGQDLATANAGNGATDAGGVSVMLQQAADVGVTVRASSPSATINSDFTYTATITNNGPGAATGVTLDDYLSSNFTIVSATSSQGSVNTATSSDVTASLGDLASGAMATVTLVVKPTQYGTAYNSVSVNSSSADPDYSNNYVSSNTPVVGASGAQVAITTTNNGVFYPIATPLPVLANGTPASGTPASGTPAASTPTTSSAATSGVAIPAPIVDGGYFAQIGKDYTYSFTVKNYGPDSATGLNFTDTLPGGVTFVSATASAGTIDSSQPGKVTAALGNLASGASATVSIVIKPTAVGSISDTASVAAADPGADPYPADNTTTVDTYVFGQGGIPLPILYSGPVGATTVALGASGATTLAKPAKPIQVTRAGLPTVAISSVRQADVTKGTTDFVFTVTRSGNLKSASTLDYTTVNGTAKAGADFQAASGQVSFASGAATATVTVPVKGSKKYKPNETFVVALAKPSNATITRARAVGTIVSAVAPPKAKPHKPKPPKPAPNPAAKGIGINFEPTAGPAVKGYLEDTGLVYGSRASGLTFGWSTDNTANAVTRRVVKDARYNTFNVLGTPGGASNWQISLPDGRYRIQLYVGDPSNNTSSYQVDANGSLVLNGKAKKKHPFVSGKATVKVTNGMLTLTPGAGAPVDYLNFMKIKYVGA